MRADSLQVLFPLSMGPVGNNTCGPLDADVSDGRRTHVFDALVVIDTRAEILEESFAAAEQDRHNR